ncbi:EF-P beta-lysylation protein EpmB [Alkalimarinus sediminis]|uniref:L-lysine 2,3-aminomutase n=1 Tax=Alkalimarinus sediminis TaxID=1632866 RepID=A0A9E8HH18_9ALTE|nr:EF-P beta-lysylation protein EpmB [Alkalimarinus sediminis]UZW74110.1 EF-P beta-lysylation protein EpmB [Alkalimarinus sediminis]
MIPRTLDAVEVPSWKEILSNAITSPQLLSEHLNIPISSISEQANRDFKLFVPEPYLQRIEKENVNDPLLKQVLPTHQEALSPAGYSKDPLAEESYNALPGLIHKYKSRVLLVSGSTCAINCRYCFRRHFPYAENRQSKEQWSTSITYIQQHPELNEVILSGGDPLVSNDKQLQWLTNQLCNIPHIKRLRIHTRLPVVIPQRVDSALLDWLSALPLQKIMVLHINHPNEIDESVRQAVKRIKATDTLVLNQSVLLAEVNDNADTLSSLSEALFDMGALPYYLHRLDKIEGAAHFDLPHARIKEIYAEMLATLPGYLIPKLVAEIPHRASKTPLDLYLE